MKKHLSTDELTRARYDRKIALNRMNRLELQVQEAIEAYNAANHRVLALEAEEAGE